MRRGVCVWGGGGWKEAADGGGWLAPPSWPGELAQRSGYDAQMAV